MLGKGKSDPLFKDFMANTCLFLIVASSCSYAKNLVRYLSCSSYAYYNTILSYSSLFRSSNGVGLLLVLSELVVCETFFSIGSTLIRLLSYCISEGLEDCSNSSSNS